MLEYVLDRRLLALSLAGTAAVLAGVAAAQRPVATLGLAAACGMVVLAHRRPQVALPLLLTLTCVVPYGLQNRLGIGGGSKSPGLLASDVLLIAGTALALIKLATRPIDRRTLRFGVALGLILAVVGVQFLAGIRAGNDLSRAGQDLRVLLGFGTFFIVAASTADTSDRDALLTGLAVVALALGSWGLLQWFGHLSFGAAGDVGVRPGVSLTAAGSGQLQGGEYGFPAAIVCCLGALGSGAAPRRLRALLAAAIAVNLFACLLTFERTFWFSVVLGAAYVVARSPRPQRRRMLMAAPVTLALVVGAFAVASPKQFATAQQRLQSVGSYATDPSVRYRLAESGFVLDQIRARPITGSGLAATIFWGRPWDQVPAKTYSFSHNGYLWLAWRLGIPAAALLVGLFLISVLLPRPSDDDPLTAGVRRGAQGAIAALLFASMTFPTFAILSITPAMGVLLALALLPAPERAPLPPAAARTVRTARVRATWRA